MLGVVTTRRTPITFMHSYSTKVSMAERGLTPAQLEQFRQDGILAIPGWLDAPTVESLKAACNKLLDDFSPESVPRSIFSTEEQSRTSDRYFLESGDKVSYFYEQKAFSTDGSLLYEPRATINKVGHDLHTKIAEFRDVSLSPSIAAACRSLGYIHPLVVQSMAIFKPPKIGGAVSPHVDGAFLYTEPQSCVGFWWPLEDCTKENGCLWAVPGSHRTPVKRRFKRKADGSGTYFDPPEPEEFCTDGAVPLEIPAGSLVLINNSVVHFSEANTSERSRHAYSIHVVEGGAGYDYPADNWLQRLDGTPFPSLY